MKSSLPTTAPVAGAFAAVAMCLLAFPSEAPAEVSHEALWGTAPGNCTTPGELRFEPSDELASYASERETHASTAPRDAAADDVSPCDGAESGAKAANNRCFEDAGAPASVVPTLLARAHALRATHQVVSAAQEAVDGTTTVADRSNPPASLPVADVPSVPNRSNPDASCTPKSPENCRNLPPAPGQLNVEASPVPPNLRSAELEAPERPDREDEHPRGTSEIERSDGYDTPPDKPPRLAARSG